MLFANESPTTTLYLRSRYYDPADGTWKNTSADKVNPAAAFLLDGTGATASVSDDGYTTSVSLINNNLAVKFGLEVSSYDSTNYKFICWYNAPEAAPNAITVDGETEDFGAQRIEGLTVPQKSTYYYALFVPKASGTLTITHSQKADSAGTCHTTNGLKLSVTFGEDTSLLYGDAATPISKAITVSESDLDTPVNITVGAKPEEGGVFAATNLNGTPVETSAADGYNEYTYTRTVGQLMSDSDTVKGLKTLKNIDFASSFYLGYTITYRYTARDGSAKTYVLRGSMDSYDAAEFKEFVIEKTPYTRTLTGDTVWNSDSIVVTKTEGGVTASMEETPNIRGFCKVTVERYDVATSYETVEYGKLFSKAQMERSLASETVTVGGAVQYFDHWEIINTKTGLPVSECYHREFHDAVWNDYTIRAVYSPTPTSGDPSESWRNVRIDYIDTSRNVWGDGEYTDKVVADMDIAFNDGTNRILDTFNDDGAYAYRLGVIFEIVGTTESDTLPDSASLLSENTANVKHRVRYVLSRSKDTGAIQDTVYDSTKTGYYYSRIVISDDTVSNFNRSEFARSFSTDSVKDKVFRVYAYMILPDPDGDGALDDDEIILSSPYYMTMYKYANQQYALDQ